MTQEPIQMAETSGPHLHLWSKTVKSCSAPLIGYSVFSLLLLVAFKTALKIDAPESFGPHELSFPWHRLLISIILKELTPFILLKEFHILFSCDLSELIETSSASRWLVSLHLGFSSFECSFWCKASLITKHLRCPLVLYWRCPWKPTCQSFHFP